MVNMTAIEAVEIFEKAKSEREAALNAAATTLRGHWNESIRDDALRGRRYLTVLKPEEDVWRILYRSLIDDGYRIEKTGRRMITIHW